MPPRRLVFTAIAFCLAGATSLQLFAQHAPSAARTSGPPRAAHPPAAPAPEAAPAQTNPLLPPQLPLQIFFPDLAAIEKQPPVAPTGFAPLYTPEQWQTYRAQYGTEADGLAKLKSSGQLAFAQKLIDAAPTSLPAHADAAASGLQRLLLLRAAAIAYRTKDGFPVADKAVTAFLAAMDKGSPTQVGALWTITNSMARTSVTPKPERIRYDGIAAKANMQLALLLLDADQADAAQAIIKQIGYHEGWIKSDKTADGAATRTRIAQVRASVGQVAKMMDYLATQYEPAIENDPNALMVVYLYGRFVKNNPAIVADLPGRVPNSPFAILASSIDAAGRNPAAGFAAAENLRVAAAILPDGLIKQRVLYASLQNYREFLNAPQTERDRIHRTLARMSVEAVIADGAHGPTLIDPFAPPTAPSTAPDSQPGLPAEPTPEGMASSSHDTLTFTFPPEAVSIADLETSVIEGGHQPWRKSPADLAPVGLRWLSQRQGISAQFSVQLAALSENPAPRIVLNAPAVAEAIWKDGGKTIAVSMKSTKPENPDAGIWQLETGTINQ